MLARGYQTDLTYWPGLGQNGYGEETFGTPVIIQGRWEDKMEEIRLPNDEVIKSEAIVFTPASISIGGYLVEGDFVAIEDPTLCGAREIRSIAKIPSLRTNASEQRAYL